MSTLSVSDLNIRNILESAFGRLCLKVFEVYKRAAILFHLFKARWLEDLAAPYNSFENAVTIRHVCSLCFSA